MFGAARVAAGLGRQTRELGVWQALALQSTRKRSEGRRRGPGGTASRTKRAASPERQRLWRRTAADARPISGLSNPRLLRDSGSSRSYNDSRGPPSAVAPGGCRCRRDDPPTKPVAPDCSVRSIPASRRSGDGVRQIAVARGVQLFGLASSCLLQVLDGGLAKKIIASRIAVIGPRRSSALALSLRRRDCPAGSPRVLQSPRPSDLGDIRPGRSCDVL